MHCSPHDCIDVATHVIAQAVGLNGTGTSFGGDLETKENIVGLIMDCTRMENKKTHRFHAYIITRSSRIVGNHYGSCTDGMTRKMVVALNSRMVRRNTTIRSHQYLANNRENRKMVLRQYQQPWPQRAKYRSARCAWCEGKQPAHHIGIVMQPMGSCSIQVELPLVAPR